MRAILIDPVAETVTETDVAEGLAALKAALQCQWIDIRSVGKDRAGRPVDLICDDEGRLIDGQRCFQMGALLIAGRGLLLSHDDEGATTACGLSLADAERPIRFHPEGYDYTPPPPMVVGFSSFEMLKFLA
ncbi:DUF3846 domain-containing protein [Sphingomonas baiyangensis]|uniref:DUF3846 domain-containing protein n=1 Tax=Sphingomonas baiyangensis TaxID=2572576 RepID=A0A4U1L3A1_9SPHN|nr:hypothetical protein [Sphingomonas baiyangensis]TKD50565.1 hypothetical protein FBR43_07150 [Sphingomonas baiyangensis]